MLRGGDEYFVLQPFQIRKYGVLATWEGPDANGTYIGSIDMANRGMTTDLVYDFFCVSAKDEEMRTLSGRTTLAYLTNVEPRLYRILNTQESPLTDAIVIRPAVQAITQVQCKLVGDNARFL